MMDALDIRTLSFTTLFFGFIYGFGLIIYSVNHKKFKGISIIGNALLCMSVGFLLLGLRQHINSFFSIIIANSAILASILLIYEGLVRFLQVEVTWEKTFSISLLALLLILFPYFTYINPDINIRVIIFSTFLSLQCLLVSNALLYKIKHYRSEAVTFLGLMFLIIALFFAFRSIWTASEIKIINFMNAGLIHGLAIVIFHFMTLATSFCVIWIASSILERELIKQARIDPLTLVYNRRALTELATIEMSRVIRNDHPLAMIICDIDHFKHFNDQHGHQAGDKVLVDFASILKSNVREHDLVSRYGGEEFLILLPETNLEHAAIIAEKLRVKIMNHQLVIPPNKTLSITASFGVANYQKGVTDWKQIVKTADRALYQAKNTGRNRVVAEQTEFEQIVFT